MPGPGLIRVGDPVEIREYAGAIREGRCYGAGGRLTEARTDADQAYHER